MTKLLLQLLTDFVGIIAGFHKGTIATEEEFFDQIEPMLAAISAEVKRNREQTVQVD